MFRRIVATLLAGTVAAGLPAASAHASMPPRGQPLATAAVVGGAPAPCADTSGDRLAEFFETMIPGMLSDSGVPGAVVSVVSQDEVVFSDGYGLADIERGTAFSPARSLVRIASITKLFTWTAVMQQVEAGRLDLDTDVNQYLPEFQLPATYPEPVTLRHLMNHTAGFEDFAIGTQAADAADVPPLAEYLEAHMPARIRPPGEVSAYSNYGAALAGYIVTVVSGEPYDRYIQRHLLEPLAMAHSTASQPVPANLAGDLARSYDTEAGTPRPIPFTFVRQVPDGSMSVTADDMANFMIAHLNEGRFGAGRILEPATAAEMHTRSFAAHPLLDGYAHGFKEVTFNGRRTLTHDGGWEGFRSILVLVPSCGLGLFLSLNGSTGGEGGYELLQGFFDQFAPPPATPEVAGPTPATLLTPAPPRAGFYHSTRRNASTVEKIVTLLGPLNLSVADDGSVQFRGRRWLPQPDGLYHSTDGDQRLAFMTGPSGRHYIVTDSTTYELLGTAETLPFNLVVLLLVVLPVLAAVAVPVVWVVRRALRRPARTTGTGWRVARHLGIGSAVLAVGFLLAILRVISGNTDEFDYRAPLWFGVLLLLPLIVLGSGLAATALTVTHWRGAGAGVLSRVHQVSLVVGLAAFAWFVWQWNLIGWQYP